MHYSLFKDTQFVVKDPLKLKSTINTCLINLNITSYYSFLLNIYEYQEYSFFDDYTMIN